MLSFLLFCTFAAALFEVSAGGGCSSTPAGGANTDKAVSCSYTSQNNYCTAACDSGFFTATGLTWTSPVQCQSGDVFSGDIEDCVAPPDCMAIPATEGTIVSPPETTYTGTPVTVSCESGWELVISTINEIMCTISGTWEPDISIFCQPIDCNAIPETPGKIVSPSSTTYTGTPETVSCETGWELVMSTVNEIMCTVGGTWEPAISTFCQRKTCTPPSPLPEGLMLAYDGGTKFENVQVYQCMSGFENEPAIQEVACGDGVYPDNQPEACTRISCTKPSPLPEGLMLTYDGGTKFGEVQVYQCLSGFEHEPAIQQVACGDGGYPLGQPEACTPVVVGGTTPGNAVDTGDTATVVSCDLKYGIGVVIGAFLGGVVFVIALLGLYFLWQYTNGPANIGGPIEMGNRGQPQNTRFQLHNPQTTMHWQNNQLMNQFQNGQTVGPYYR